MLTYPTFPWYLRALNGVDRRIRRLGLGGLRFEPAALLEIAAEQAGLHDFAEDALFREALEVLCRSAEEDAHLTLVGRRVIRQLVVRGLVNRLRTVDAQKYRPEVARTALVPPIIVLGLPRSGTTLLHHLLAMDRNARPLRFWELAEPIPAPGPDVRRETLQRTLAGMKRLDAGIDAKHHFEADNPEECMLLLDGTLVSLSYWVFSPVHGYLEWLRKQDHRAPYRTYRWLLQSFQRLEPGRRLTLKAPAHTGALPALLEAVPEALVVQTHRDSAEVVASLNSLIFSLHALVADPIDIQRMAETSMAHLQHMIEQCEAGRARAPRAVLDVQYAELIRDPAACVKRIYRHFDLELDDSLLERVRQFVAERPKDKYGRHEYSAEDFGTSEAAIRERFAGYHRRYLPAERGGAVMP